MTMVSGPNIGGHLCADVRFLSRWDVPVLLYQSPPFSFVFPLSDAYELYCVRIGFSVQVRRILWCPSL